MKKSRKNTNNDDDDVNEWNQPIQMNETPVIIMQFEFSK